MERIRTRIIIAVAERLSSAKDSNAKTELIEELSENLYQRYADLTASGVNEEEAYRRAMEDLGDVSELLEYLSDMDGGASTAESQRRGRDYLNDFLKGVEDVVRETIAQTKDAVGQAKVITRDIGRKLHEKYPDGFEGNFHVHYDTKDTDHGEHPEGADAEGKNCENPNGRTSGFSVGYSKERGGFFWESTGKGRPVTENSISVENVTALDVQLHNGDVNIYVAEQDTVEISGDTEELEVRLSDTGVLSVRQGKTASSSVIFGRGLACANVDLTLPKKVWASIKLNTVNGDICLNDMLETEHLTIQTVSGDVTADQACCPQMTFKSVSGDINGEDLTGSVRAESVSGDISLSGRLADVSTTTVSGDIQIMDTVETVSCNSMSGDVSIETGVLPGALHLSSKSGDCRAMIPATEGFTVELNTLSGDLHTDFDLVGPMGRKSGSAVYLDGGNRNFSISSTSGDITLEKC